MVAIFRFSSRETRGRTSRFDSIESKRSPLLERQEQEEEEEIVVVEMSGSCEVLCVVCVHIWSRSMQSGLIRCDSRIERIQLC